MSVLSWRSVWPFLPITSSIFFRELSSAIWASIMMKRIQMCVSALTVIGLAGCAQSRQDTELPRTSDPKINKALDECYPDALKILYTAPRHTAGEYRATQFMDACMKAKGYDLSKIK